MRRHEIEEYRDAVVQHIQKIEPNLLLTFNFNPPRSSRASTNSALLKGWEIQPENGCKRIKDFFSMLLRKAYGRGWYRDVLVERPIAYGFLENPEKNFHYHLLVKMSAELAVAVKEHGPSTWHKLCPGGQFDVKDIYGNLPYLTGYVGKQLQTEAAVKAMFVYSDPNSIY